MKFKFHIGTKVFFGDGCLKEHKDELGKFGRKAVIVTGRNSGKASGALEDVCDVLKASGMDFFIYDRVENNPSMETVKEGGDAAREFGAELIIGIGGGSPLDAAKAIAVLSVNDMDPLDLYKNQYENKPLPVVCVPTTAGTGSEVTPYAILTRKDIQFKRSFGNEDTFPKVSFLDARYTASLPYDITVNTAVDALSHAVEGYISKRSTPASDILAVQSIELFGQCIDSMIAHSFDHTIREKLLYMAMLGGMVIAHTGTTIVHPMGYALTYFKGVPHGKANGYFMKEYLDFNDEAAGGKVETVLRLLGMRNTGEFGVLMDKLLGNDLILNREELLKFASIVIEQRSIAFNVRSVAEEDIFNIMTRAVGECKP